MTRILLIVLLCLGGTAAAQDGSVFTVPRVPVFAEDEDAARAQAKAQEQGRRVAMDLLLRRLTAEEDWRYLPQLSSGSAALAISAAGATGDDEAFGGDGLLADPYAPDPYAADPYEQALSTKRDVDLTPGDLPRYELSFAPYDEKTSRTTYRAEVTYRFNPDAVRSLLTEAGIPYSESQSRRALVLPVLETEEDLYLWEAKNPWARAWLSRPLDNELTPLLLPQGHQQDVETLTAEEAKALDQDALRALAERYRVPQVILAHATLTEADGEQRLLVRLVDGYLDGRGDNRRRLDGADSTALYDDEDGFGQGASRSSAGSPGQVVAEAFYRAPAGDFPALAKRATERTVADYASDWKARTLVDHAAMREFGLTAWFTSLDEWAEIRQALSRTALVREMETGVFNNENAVIGVTAIGTPTQFELAMSQQNLTVWLAENGWHISANDQAEALQARFEPVDPPELGEERLGERSDERRRDAFGRGARGPDEARGRDRGRVPELPASLFGEEADERAGGERTRAEEDFLLGDY